MKRTECIHHFSQLGKIFKSLGSSQSWPGYELGLTETEYDDLTKLIERQFHFNGWFTETSVRNVLNSWGELLVPEQLENWLHSYSYAAHPKRIGIIMAGNIPLVGFHDFLSVLLSGNKAVIKLSSSDSTLLPACIQILYKLDAEFENLIEVCPGKLGEIDAVIATGSNNSMHYFESYFGKYPHVFRKNRTSLAILTGKESDEELKALGSDIFTYFGLGCRNVSQLMIPQDYELSRFFQHIISYSEVVNHHKYANNYDYNKAIFLMNQEQLLDNGFLLLKESDELFSPLGMLYYSRYNSMEEVKQYIQKNEESIQALVGSKHIPFGQAQCPKLNDYADGLDVMAWLNGLA